MGIITDYYLGGGVEVQQLKAERKAERKAACENSTLGKIFKATVFDKQGKEIKPFDLTKVGEEIAEKTHLAVKEVLTFNAYLSPTVKSEAKLCKLFLVELSQFTRAMGGLRNPADPKTADKSSIETFRVGLQFIELMKHIYTTIKDKEKFTIQDVHSLRTNIRSALNLMKSNEKLFNNYPRFAPFLQALSYQITTKVQGMNILESMGKQALAWCENPATNDGKVTLTQLANHAEEAFHRMPANDWDTPAGWLKWAITNPKEALFAQLDNSTSWGHAYYNSYERGNVALTYGYVKVGDKKIRMCIGAGAMNDAAISEAAMNWGKLKGEIQVAHTLEFNEKKGERTRLENLVKLVKRIYNGIEKFAIYLVKTPHDGKIEKGKGEFSKIKSVEDFHDKLIKLGLEKQRTIEKNSKGFALPKPLLSEEDIKSAIESSKNAVKVALPETELNKDSTAEHNQRLSSALLANFNTFLEVKMLINLGNMLAEKKIDEATYTMVCKQCFDRGPLANAILLAYVKLIEKDHLDANDEKQILGLLTGRTMMGGGDRKMVENRRQTFIDLFKTIGRNQDGFVKQLQAFAGGKGSIAFVPS